MEIQIPIYDLRRISAEAFVVDNIRFVLKLILDIHKDKSLNENISRQKSMELFLRLIYEDPRPLLQYRLTGNLHRVGLVGKGKKAHFVWLDDYFRDCYIPDK